ncbi:ubiquinone anaerobic biosynthesis protein UbiU [Roseospira visakhapatnamensis]|uniref:Ubiquinone biosynthesis protein UbiU n=1 Tax=Roseospira visakhapatnamensis TaxID=390880 RepID=A0A7W6W8T6_9PROT|nr:peptidase U32 family protein [Roseospira visakhapatnamensis]MBB4264756.1 putative protease [Roseospira visakhapatnamensis]
MTAPMELVCPAGTPAALDAAIEAGADAVYFGFRNRTNARNFPGLNFSEKELAEGVAACDRAKVRPMIAINTYPDAGDDSLWRRAVDCAAEAGAGAVILCDMGLAAYAAQRHPSLRLHLSVQASASNVPSVRFYREAFGIHRVVLPRVMTVEQIAALTAAVPDVETEVFVFGGLCVMAEGRCCLSSYATGISPNKDGACSPASHVRYEQQGETMISRLGEFVVNRFGAGEQAGYPTICKGRYQVLGREMHLFEDPLSLDATSLVPAFAKAGVTALKVEGRQRGKAYVSQVVRSLKAAIAGAAPPAGQAAAFMEGGGGTTGVYAGTWH